MNALSEKTKTLVLSIASALVMGVMIACVYRFNVPNPNMILIIVLVFFTGVGGWIPGAISALLIIAYSMFFFSTDNSFLQFTDVNAQKMLIILVGDLSCFLAVAMLKSSRDKNRRELVESNRHLSESNKILEEKAAADAKIAELSQSVTSLLTNMPALTFSKDISTGKYLACNQLFAEYAHKPSPEGVVGLTDHDIFDSKTADHFVEDDRIALSMDEPYTFLEDVPDAAGFPRHFQTTKQKFYDEQGRLCTLGMCVDVTELVHMKQETQEVRKAFEKTRYESLIYSHIASSLSADYTYVYYVDLETDEYVEYHAINRGDELSTVDAGRDFFNLSRAKALTALYEADQATFLTEFSKERIVAALDERGLFTLDYRLMVDGKPEYVNMKASWMKNDEQHIVIGVMNVDAQVKAQEAAKRAKEERVTYARINALSSDYIAIYSVDPESGHYQQYSASALYDELDLAKEGEDFFALSRANAQRVVYHEDLEKFTSLFTRANVLREIHSTGIFALKYRLLLERQPIYVRLKAALVEEHDGLRLVVGVINISEQVKQDQEYEYHLSVVRTLANRDELTGVKNKHAYAELERELNLRIEGREPVDFCIVAFDVNELKVVNDTQGHQAGDHHLKQASALICNTFKHSPVFRIGGDEFAVISQGDDLAHVDDLVSKLQDTCRENHASNGISLACGVARYCGELNVASVFEKADKRMYENKREMKAASTRERE